jgi:hypothetical protein
MVTNWAELLRFAQLPVLHGALLKAAFRWTTRHAPSVRLTPVSHA